MPTKAKAELEQMRQQFDDWATDGRILGEIEMQFAWEAWKASAEIERRACANAAMDAPIYAADPGEKITDDAKAAAWDCAAAILNRCT